MPTATRSLALVLSLAVGTLVVSPASAQTMSPVPDPTPVITPADQAAFEQWVKVFARTAKEVGISAEAVDTNLTGLTLSERVVRANESQPEFTRSVWDYLNGVVREERITQGQSLLTQHQAILADVERKYGVQGRYIMAIWAIETNFGSILGSHNVFEALATLGYRGRRTAYGRSQLLAALKLADRGDMPATGMVGSWAGAMGQTQFIPTTYLDYAVDGDGDGARDLWTSLPDVFHSTAAYLERSGWQRGLDWGREVAIGPDFDFDLVGRTTYLPLNEWAARGVTGPGGDPLPQVDVPARMVIPAGHRGPAFLVFRNFDSILRYNASTSYALAVGHLADRIAGGFEIQQAWPTDLRPLSRSERKELQERLNTRGFGAGKVDGIIGANTRKAIKGFQKQAGLVADGYPSSELLQALRTQ